MIYFYRLFGGGGGSNFEQAFNALNKRGLAGLVNDNHPEVVSYNQIHGVPNSLYIGIERELTKFVSDRDVMNTRTHSVRLHANKHLITRMIDVRTEWSKK